MRVLPVVCHARGTGCLPVMGPQWRPRLPCEHVLVQAGGFRLGRGAVRINRLAVAYGVPRLFSFTILEVLTSVVEYWLAIDSWLRPAKMEHPDRREEPDHALCVSAFRAEYLLVLFNEVITNSQFGRGHHAERPGFSVVRTGVLPNYQPPAHKVSIELTFRGVSPELAGRTCNG
jgi:hypothetical protein